MSKPQLSDWKRGRGDPWDDPVWAHNAGVIQAKLDAVLYEAHAAGVQVEMHEIRDGDVVEAVELSSPSVIDDGDGVLLVASPDPDRNPTVVLDHPGG